MYLTMRGRDIETNIFNGDILEDVVKESCIDYDDSTDRK